MIKIIIQQALISYNNHVFVDFGVLLNVLAPGSFLFYSLNDIIMGYSVTYNLNQNQIKKSGYNTTGSISPWNELIKRTMLRTQYTLWPVQNIHWHSVEVGCSPLTFFLHLVPVHYALLLAYGAEALASLKRASMNEYAWLFVSLPVCLVRSDGLFAFFYMHEVEI